MNLEDKWILKFGKQVIYTEFQFVEKYQKENIFLNLLQLKEEKQHKNKFQDNKEIIKIIIEIKVEIIKIKIIEIIKIKVIRKMIITKEVKVIIKKEITEIIYLLIKFY